MRFAKDAMGNFIDAGCAVDTNKYFCPTCHAAVMLRSGKYRRKHFAHVCRKQPVQQYNNEEHLAIQDELMQWFQRFGLGAVAELRHLEAGRRADIAVGECQLCIEVQCSPITVAEIMSRTEDYRHIYEHILWLSSAKVLRQLKSDKFQVPAFILQKLYVQDKLYFFSVQQKKLIILTNIIRISPTVILATKLTCSVHDNPAFLLTDNLRITMRKYGLQKYMEQWQRNLRYNRKYAVMNYELTHRGVDFKQVFSAKYALPQIHIGIFNWQLVVAWQYFCYGVTDSRECLLIMEKEKTVASVTEATVRGVEMFMKHLRALEHRGIR